MATALYSLRTVQIGLEAQAAQGTPVAATQQIVGNGMLSEIEDRVFENYPRGTRAPVTDGGFPTRRASEVTLETNASFEEVLYPLLTGIANVAAPTAGTGTPAPQTWAFVPTLTGAGAPATATFEMAVTDGTNEHYERRAGYGVCTQFGLTAAQSGMTTMSATWAARAAADQALTASLVPIANRTPIPAGLWTHYMDDSWANLGTTRIASLVRNAELTVNPGVRPAEGMQGRDTLDYAGLESGDFTAQMSFTIDYNAAAKALFGHFRATDKRFLRMEAVTGSRKLTIDMAGFIRAVPTQAEADRMETFVAVFDCEHDAAGTFAATVVNFVTARP